MGRPSECDWLKPTDSRYLALLRSVAILVIVFGHVGGFWIYPPWTEFLHVFVPVFFFISGAVSYNGFVKKRNVAQYLSKRILGLIVPYYCICMVALLVFLIQHARFPKFNFQSLVAWATMIPSKSIMPFPLGQVWFLHTLMIICLLSPLIFWLYQQHRNIFMMLLPLSVAASFVQLNYDIAPLFRIGGHDLFKPLVHSLFFCLGFMVIDMPNLRSSHISRVAVVTCAVLSVSAVGLLDINPDYAEHTYSPDAYYVAGSLGAIWSFLLMQSSIIKHFDALPSVMQSVSRYLFRHTYAIFLLHSLVLYLVERVFGLVGPQEKTITYGIVKLVLVLSVTLALSPAFTGLSSFMNDQLCRIPRHVARRWS